ncbi:MAG: AlpA family phage regulatory protein [Pseudomonadota bacterium]
MTTDTETGEGFWNELRPRGRILRPSEVIARCGMSKSQVYSLIARKQFPPFVKLSERASGMPENWLDAFISEKARAASQD